MFCKRIRDIKEPLDIDLQLMATEMDTSVNRIKFLSKGILENALTVESFEKLINDIENGDGVEITSFDDNTILYEFLDEAVVIHTMLSEKYLLFDSIIATKIENKMSSYKD